MSKNIDENIVELRFDNTNFEKNVSTSMSTLEKLKQKLNFSGATTALDSLASSAKNLTFDTAYQGVQKLEVGFSTLGVVGINVISNITQSLIGMTTQVANVVTGLSAMKAGFEEYQLQMGSIQTIMSNTQSKGSTLSDVNEALDELNNYADLTIYNFGQMTKNIGTFTAAGVDLQTSVNSIKGIANLAAASGSSSLQASTAMYQLSQAIAAGKVQLMDWNSVVNAGMGGELFQNALKRTAENAGTDVDALIEKYGSFRESLTEGGWLTVDVLTETLEQIAGVYSKEELLAQGYTEEQAEDIVELAETATNAATKVKTFAELWDVIGEEAGSGWTKTWTTFFGDYEYAKNNLTWFANYFQTAIQNMSNSRNDVLSEGLDSNWDKLLDQIQAASYSTSDFTDLVEESLTNQGYDVTDLKEKYGTLEEMFKQGVVPAETLTECIEKLEGATADLSDVTEGLSWGAGITDESTADQVTKVQQALKDLGYDLGEYGDNVDGVDGKFGDMTQAAIIAFQAAHNLEQTGIIDEATLAALEEATSGTEKLTGKVEDYIAGIDKLGGRDRIWQGVRNVIQAIAKVAGSAKTAIQNIFPSITADNVYSATEAFQNFTEKLIISDESADKLTQAFEGVFAIVRTVAILVGGPLKAAIAIASTIFTTFDGNVLDVLASFGQFVKSVNDGIRDFTQLDIVKESFQKLYDAFKKVVENIQKLLTGGWTDSIGDIFTPLVNGVKDFASGISDAIAQTPLAGVAEWVSGIVGKITSAASEFASNIDLSAIVEKVKEFLGISEGEGIGENFLQGFINGVTNFVQTVIDTVKAWASDTLAKVKEIFDIHSPSQEMEGVGENFIQGFIDGVTNKIEAAKTAVVTFASGVLDKVKNFFSGIDVGSFAPIVIFAALIGSLALLAKNLKDAVFDKISEPLEKVKKAVEGLGNEETKADKLEKKAKALRNFAIAVGILVAAIVALGYAFNDPKCNMTAALVTVGGITVLLAVISGALMFLSNKFPTNSEVKLEGVSSTLAAFAVCMAVVSACVWALAQCKNVEQGIVAVGFVAAFIVLVYLAIAKITKQNASTKGLGQAQSTLTAMAILLGVASACVYVLGNMDPTALQQGTNAVLELTGLLALLMIFVGVANKIASSGKSLGSAEVSLQGMAALLAVMAGCVWVLGTMDTNTLNQGVGALTALMILLALFVIFIGVANKIASSGKSVGAAEVSIKGVSALLVTMTACVWVLGTMDESAISQATGCITWLMALIVGMVALFSLIQKKLGPQVEVTQATFISLAVLIAVMAAAVWALGSMDEGTIVQGTAAMTAIAALIAGILVATSKASACIGPLVLLAVIFALVAVALGVLSTVCDTDKVLTVAISLAVVFAALAVVCVAAIAVGTFAAAAALGMTLMLVFVAALAILVYAILAITDLALKNMPDLANNLSKFMTDLQPFLTGLDNVGADKLVKAALLIAIMEALDIAMLVSLLGQLVSFVSGGGSAKALSNFMTDLQPLLTGLDNVTADKAAKAALLYGIIAALSIGEIIAALGQLASWIGGGQSANCLSDFLMDLQPGLIALSVVDETMAVKAALLLGIITAMSLSEIIAAIGELATWLGGGQSANCLSEFVTDLQPFLEGLNGVNDGSAEKAGQLYEAIKAMSLGEIVAALTELVTGLTGFDIVSYGQELSNFMAASEGFITGASNIDTSIAEKVGSLSAAICAMAGSELVSAFCDGIATLLGGGSGDFTSKLTELGDGLAGFGSAVEGIEVASFTVAASAAPLLVDCLTSLTLDAFADSVLGDSSTSSYIGNISTLGENLASFGESVKDIDVMSFSYAVTAAACLAEVMNAIPSEGGVAGLIFGDKDMQGFGESVGYLGAGLLKFGESVRDIGSDDFSGVESCANALSILMAQIPSSGGLADLVFGSETQGITNFASSAASLGEGLASFASACTAIDVSEDKLSQINNIVTTLTDLQKNLPTDGGLGSLLFGSTESFSDFTSNAGELVDGLNEFGKKANDMIDIDQTKMDAVKSASTALTDIAKEMPTEGGVMQWFTGTTNMGDFGQQAASFALGLKLFANRVKDFPEDIDYTNLENCTDFLKNMGSVVGTEGGLLNKAVEFFCGDQNFDTFKDQATKYASAILAFGNTVACMETDIPWDNISQATACLASMGEIVGGSEDNLVDRFLTWVSDGEIDKWSEFETNAGTFAKAICAFGSELTNFTFQGNIDSVVASVECIQKLSELVKDDSSIFSSWDSNSQATNLVDNFGSLGEAISTFADNVSGITDKGLDNARTALELMEDWGASDYLDTDFEKFGENFASFGGKLGDFDTNTASIDLTRWTNIGDALETMNSKVSGISGMTSITDDDMTNFSDNVNKLASVDTSSAQKSMSNSGLVLATTLTSGFSDNSGQFTTAVKSVMTDAVTVIGSYANTFAQMGTNITIAIASGIYRSASVTSALYTALSSAASSASSYAQERGTVVGYWLGVGLAQGISSDSVLDQVAKAAASAVTKAVDTMNSTGQISSPSKVTRRTGGWLSAGLAVGMLEKQSSIEDAAEQVTNSAIAAISAVSSAMEDSDEFTPTIRPVVDLSNIQNGSKTIDSWLSYGGVSSVSAVMAERYSYASNDDIVNAINGLGSDISNMPRNNYNVNGVTYDDGSSTARAVSDLTRAIKIRRRS